MEPDLLGNWRWMKWEGWLTTWVRCMRWSVGPVADLVHMAQRRIRIQGSRRFSSHHPYEHRWPTFLFIPLRAVRPRSAST